MKIPLDRSSQVPLARQICHYLMRLILSDLLTPGVKLPATRELARDLGANRSTVAAAYELLVAEGYATARVGQGTFVAPRRSLLTRPSEGPVPSEASPVEWEGLFSKVSQLLATDPRSQEFHGLLSRTQDGAISFVGGMPDSNLFPTDLFRKVLNKAVKQEGDALLQYHPVAGYAPLRQYLSSYLLKLGIEAHASEILIVNGSQQGLDLIARTLLDPGDPVLMENPTYLGAIQIFRAQQAQLIPVAVGPHGLRVEAAVRLVGRYSPKLLYCQPTHQNPTGLTMPSGERRDLLALARRHRLPIVEDGFDWALSYEGDPPASLRAMDRSGLVIHLGTFSKILFPGLRLGWVVAPPPVLERLQGAKQLSDLHTPTLVQAALYHFCQRRLLEPHMRRIQGEYGRRRGALLGALKRHMPEGTIWTIPTGGFSLVVTLPGIDTTELLLHAAERGVLYTPGSFFYMDHGGRYQLRLSFAGLTPGKIDEGVRRLGEVVRAAFRRMPAESDRGEGASTGLPLV